MTDVVQDFLALVGCLFMMLFFVCLGLFMFRLGEVPSYESNVNGILEAQGGFTPTAVREIKTLDYDYRNGYLGNNADDSFHIMPENDINNSVHHSSNDEKIYRFGNQVTGLKYRTLLNHQGYGDPIYYRIFMSIPGLPKYMGSLFNIQTTSYNAEDDAQTTSKVDLVDTNDANGGKKKNATPVKPKIVTNYVKFYDDGKQYGNYQTYKGYAGSSKRLNIPNGYYLTKGESDYVKLRNANNRIIHVDISNNEMGTVEAKLEPVAGSRRVPGVYSVLTRGRDGNPFTALRTDKGNLPGECHVVNVTTPPSIYIGGQKQKFIIYYRAG